MPMLSAIDRAITGLRSRLGIPPAVPPFGDRTFRIYRWIWIAVLALALAGSVAGLYDRFTGPSDNSGLMLGSRVGIVVAEEDATRIRTPVGRATVRLGIRPGDQIVAVDGVPLPEVLPFAPADYQRHADDPGYAVLAKLFYGGEPVETVLRIRSVGGYERDVRITAGEQHIADGARAMGIPPASLRVVDLLHVLTYPFLFGAAWLLHRRQPRDPVSSILSLAVLLTILTEQPAAYILDVSLGVSRPVHVLLYDLGNILLLGAILLFPDGNLSNRRLVLLALLPSLLFLSGEVYRLLFIAFMIVAVLLLIERMRRVPPGEAREQVKWALFGFAGYAAFLSAALVNDMLRWRVDSFAAQLILEMTAGLNLGIAYLALLIGLLIALLRYRLYDSKP
jgi:hypothetical protein